MNSFFLPGKVEDPSYQNVRDSPNLVKAKAFVEFLWQIYCPLADDNFRTDARNHFLQRFWEMYLACTLMERGFKLHPPAEKSKGPEFYFIHDGRKVWVAAVAPGPGIGTDMVPPIVRGECFTVPIEKIILRFTSALRDKYLKINNDIGKGIIGREDSIVLALNSRGIPHGPFGADLPHFLKAFLPIGNLTLELNPRTRQITDSYHTERPAITKKSGAEVPTKAFLDSAFSHFAGVFHSTVDWVNRPPNLGEDFDFLHNPSAVTSFPQDLLSWWTQYEYIDDHFGARLRRSSPL